MPDFAALFGVGNKDTVGERGDIGIALDCKIGCGAADAVGERGQNQQVSFGQRLLPAFRNPHLPDKTTMDAEPRNNRSRHSFSIGD